jgi:hypothetical protein
MLASVATNNYAGKNTSLDRVVNNLKGVQHKALVYSICFVKGFVRAIFVPSDE